MNQIYGTTQATYIAGAAPWRAGEHEQNERFDTALKTFMHTLERLEQL